MKRIQVGHKIEELHLPGLNGNFDLNQIQGKRYMLSFHRFASCPFCNLRIHQLVSFYDEFPQDFTIVAVFDSPLDNLKKHATRHKAPFPILADEENIYYKKFKVERSLWGTIWGSIIRVPTGLYSVFAKGFIPLTFKGKLTTMPLELFVDENNIVQFVHYGKDEGDHVPLAEIKKFAQGDPVGKAFLEMPK